MMLDCLISMINYILANYIFSFEENLYSCIKTYIIAVHKFSYIIQLHVHNQKIKQFSIEIITLLFFLSVMKFSALLSATTCHMQLHLICSVLHSSIIFKSFQNTYCIHLYQYSHPYALWLYHCSHLCLSLFYVCMYGIVTILSPRNMYVNKNYKI